MKYCFLLLLLVSMSLEMTEQDTEEVNYDDDSASISASASFESASISLYDRNPCSFRGFFLAHGAVVTQGPCTECRCKNGTTTCRIEACAVNLRCPGREIVYSPTECCPYCPHKLEVTGVNISQEHDSTLDESSLEKIRFKLHVAVNSQMSSKTVKGIRLWRLGVWMSANIDGSGRRTSYNQNIFNEENAAKPYHRNAPHNFEWSGLEYRIEPDDEPCGNYFCVEFGQGIDPRPLYHLLFTLQPLGDTRESLVGCLAFSNCNATEFHPDFTSKRVFERQIGESINLKCRVTYANRVWWQHSSWAKTQRVSSSKTFRIENISLEDQGTYYCVAEAHGQQVRSAEQVLIIPGMAQFLLKTEAISSTNDTLQEMILFQRYIVSQMEEANVIANAFNTTTEVTQTIYLSKKVKPGQELNSIRKEIWNILQESINSSALADVSNISFRLEGLSLCFDDAVATEAGSLSFLSVNINTEISSNELCVFPRKLSRGSGRCEGDLVTAAVWKDTHFHNCFMKPNKENTRRRIASFFQIMKKSLVTTNNVAFVSRDLVDITKASTIGLKEAIKMTSVLEQVCSANSTLEMVTSNVLNTVDKMISAVGTSSNEDGLLPPAMSSRILQSVKLQLENGQRNGENFSLSLQNIEVEVVHISYPNKSLSFEACPLSSEANPNAGNMTSEDQIPGDCSNGTSIHIPADVMNMLFTGHNQRIFPVTITSYQSHVLFNDRKARKGNKRLDSIIISVSTSYKVDNLPEGSFIRISFTTLSVSHFQRSCVFWDYSLYKKTGGWSSEGCQLKDSSDSNTYICECDHFADFALLLEG